MYIEGYVFEPALFYCLVLLLTGAVYGSHRNGLKAGLYCLQLGSCIVELFCSVVSCIVAAECIM